MNRIFYTLIGICIVFAIFAGIFFFGMWPEMFDDTNITRFDGLTTFGARVSEFQTLIGGIVASFVALITALIIYAAAITPSWLSQQREDRTNAIKEKTVSGVLARAVFSLRGELLRERGERIKDSEPVNWNFNIPSELTDFGMIDTQSPEIVNILATIPLAITAPLPQQNQTKDEKFIEDMIELQKIDVWLFRLEATLANVTDAVKAAELLSAAERIENANKESEGKAKSYREHNETSAKE